MVQDPQVMIAQCSQRTSSKLLPRLPMYTHHEQAVLRTVSVSLLPTPSDSNLTVILDQLMEFGRSCGRSLAIKGAEYNSPGRQPHPMCLEGTRVDLLDHVYRLLEDPEMSRIVWLKGTAGVRKSVVAFTAAEQMRALHMKDQTSSEKRLGGTFFFSRKYTERYQPTSNFPKDDLTSAIHENSALLDPRKSPCNQMELPLFLDLLGGADSDFSSVRLWYLSLTPLMNAYPKPRLLSLSPY